MVPTAELLVFALVVLVAFVSGAMAGFGSVIIALTLAGQFYSIEWMVPRLVALNVLLNGYLVIAHRGHVAWRLLLTRLIWVMGAGAGLGVLVQARLEGSTLKTAFGALVVVLSSLELYRLFAKRDEPGESTGGASLPFVFGAGIMHGIYASGGPMLVYALGRSGLARTAFRSTLAMIWLAMNVGLTVVFLLDGRLDGQALTEVGWLTIPVVAATAIGEVLHHRVDERGFRIVLFCLLFAAGIALLF